MYSRHKSGSRKRVQHLNFNFMICDALFGDGVVRQKDGRVYIPEQLLQDYPCEDLINQLSGLLSISTEEAEEMTKTLQKTYRAHESCSKYLTIESSDVKKLVSRCSRQQ